MAATFRDYISIMRPQQWYKNCVIFVALIFSYQLFAINLFLLLAAGFIVLCLASSANYIINDVIDIEKDKIHPEKGRKPIPSGRIGKKSALSLAAVLMGISLAASFYLGFYFGLTVVSLIAGVTIYSLFLKKIVIIDIMSIATFFVIRVMGGVALLMLRPSPWLILCAFLLALLLATDKRMADIKILKESATQHKTVLQSYNESFLDTLISIITSTLILSYALYVFQKFPNSYFMIATIPVSIFVLFRYNWFMYTPEKITRNAERIFKDPLILLGGILWVLMVVISLYGLL